MEIYPWHASELTAGIGLTLTTHNDRHIHTYIVSLNEQNQLRLFVATPLSNLEEIENAKIIMTHLAIKVHCQVVMKGFALYERVNMSTEQLLSLWIIFLAGTV